MSLCRLIYRSVANADVVSNPMLRDLERKASAANSDNDITGLLVLAGNTFVQALEGDSKRVTALFTRIAGDRRHRDVELVSHSAVARRSFDGWGMRLVDLYDLPGDKRAFMVAKYGKTDDQLQPPEDAQMLLSWLFDARFLCLSAPWNGPARDPMPAPADERSTG